MARDLPNEEFTDKRQQTKRKDARTEMLSPAIDMFAFALSGATTR
jgi:hypothetical protein